MEKKEFTMDWPLVGNRQITDYLAKCIAKDRVAGTYIFSGPDNLGKTTTARYFAKALLCGGRRTGSGPLPCGECPSCRQIRIGSTRNRDGEDEADGERHGDLHVIKSEKEKKNISIEAVRGFIRALNMSSFLGSYKIGIVKHAERLSEGAANALLKTLEEPKKDVIIVLVARNADILPPTIASRSQILSFHPVDGGLIYEHLIAKHKASRSEAKNYSRLCLGRPALAVKFLEDRGFREKYMKQAEIFLGFFRQDLNKRLDAVAEALGAKTAGQEAVREARRMLEIWQGVARDRLLLEYGLNDLVQHQPAEKRLAEYRGKTGVPALLDLVKMIRRADEYLAANVNPRTVLENVAINV